MATAVNKSEYGYHVVEKDVQQILHTNATTRILLYGEMVVVKDAANNCFIGFVKEIDGIAASGGIGRVDLETDNVVNTTQADFANDTFVVKDSVVFVTIQTNSVPALIRQATATGLFTLNALIVAADNVEDGNIQLRMPPQDGTIIAVPA